jgi:hypothetical protein
MKKYISKIGLGLVFSFFTISTILLLYAIIFKIIPSSIFLIFCIIDIIVSIALTREFLDAFINYTPH